MTLFSVRVFVDKLARTGPGFNTNPSFWERLGVLGLLGGGSSVLTLLECGLVPGNQRGFIVGGWGG